jgi:hypothetical protein
MRRVLRDVDYHLLNNGVMEIAGKYLPCVGMGDSCPDDVSRAVVQCDWDEFYDILELVAGFIAAHYAGKRDGFSNDVNAILRRNFMTYELREGRVERVGTKLEDRVVAEARGIPRDDDLAGPNEQFLKATGFFSQRPEPDEENCVKEAIGTAEGVARVLLNNPSILLSNAVKEIGKRKGVHPTLQKLIADLYAYRGDAEGAAHGKTGAKPEIRLGDAELLLNTSAALIVYMARLFGREVE